MKQSFVLCIVLLLLSPYDAAECGSPSEPPVLSPSPELSLPGPPVLSPSQEPSLSEPPVLSPSPEPSNNDCSTVIYGMLDCLSFLTVGSTDLSPTKSCCDGVETVLEYNPNCLCVALESSRSMGFDLSNRRALAMPSICNIHIDPHCDVVASSPATSTLTPSTPTISPSKPRTTSPPPAVITPSPSVTPSPPPVTHTSPVRPASPPTITHSSPGMTAPSPAMVAPSPSKSGVTNLSVSKLFLTIVITASFAYVLA